MHTVETNLPIFATILVGYLGLSLAIGALSVYFKPYKEPAEESPSAKE